MRFDVKRASIDDDLRELFEQYGEQVVAMALALGSNQGTGMRTRRPHARDEGGSYPSRCRSTLAPGEKGPRGTSRDYWYSREHRPPGFHILERGARNYQLVPWSSLRGWFRSTSASVGKS